MDIHNEKLECFLLVGHDAFRNSTVLETMKSPPEIRKLMTSLMVLIVIFIIASNSMLIIGLYKTSTNLSLPSKMFVFLSCNDMLAGLSYFSTGYIFIKISCDLGYVMISVSSIFIICSVEIFLTVSALRFISLKKPLTRILNHHVYVLLFIEWLLGSGVGLIIYFSFSNLDTESLPIFLSIVCLMYLISIVLVGLINLLSYKALNTEDGSCTVTGTSNISSSDQIRKQRKRTAVVTLIFISLSYFVLNLPASIYYMYLALRTISIEQGKILNVRLYVEALEIMNCMQYIVLATTGTNAVIYIVRSKEIKLYYRLKLLNFIGGLNDN